MKAIMRLVVAGMLLSGFSSGANEMADTYSVIQVGERFSAEDAEALEVRLKEQPVDVVSRTQLLGYYFGKQYGNQAFKKAVETHVLWLIEHAPDAGVLGLPYGQLNKHLNAKAYQQGKAAWLVQLEKRGDDVAILKNAAAYFTQSDRNLAEKSFMRLMELEPKNPEWPKDLGHLYALDMQTTSAEQERKAAVKALAQFEAAYALSSLMGKDPLRADIAKAAFKAGDFDKASEYAHQMLKLSGAGWNSGNNIHYGNIVLGHVALAKGDTETAAAYLIKAGETKGSPQLDSFGPNMTLAQELLIAGEDEAVLKYLEACGHFWDMDRGRLKKWAEAIHANKDPFGGARIKY